MSEEELPVPTDQELLRHAGREIDERRAVSLEIEFDRTPDDIRNNRPGVRLREKILSLPQQPGVYMYLDRHGKVIYVGKAKNLKRRITSYFNRIHDSVRTNLLVRNIADLRFIVVPTEQDALLLENANIKAWQPRYNVLLKDDKSYPWIVVTNEDYPRIFMTRDRNIKGRYYGPYSNVGAARAVLDLIRKVYPLRSCKHAITSAAIASGKFRPCLDFHIGKCGAPCAGYVSKEEYGKYIASIRKILNGETVTLQNFLRRQMQELSEQWKFEEAQDVKEKYLLLEKYNAKSVIAGAEHGSYDVFAFGESGETAFVNFMHLKDGAVVQSLTLEYRRRLGEQREEILSMAIAEISRRFERKLENVIVPFMPDVEFEDLEITVPQRGSLKKMLDVGNKNVQQYISDWEKEAEKKDPERSVQKLMQQMQSDFRLKEEPRHIECFDNSNIQGTNPVASCVVFRNGKPSKKDYRHFIIKSVEGPDDFASMKEVLHRRYSRMISEGEELPQLVVVDGGKGQLSAAVEAFDELGIRGEVALAGIAKRLEEIYFPGDTLPLYIDKRSPSLRVVQALRDEAHRFGITHHRNRRSKSAVTSALTEIKGIGSVTSAKLMKHFKSMKRLRAATEEEIAAVVGQSKAREIISALFNS